MDTPKPNPRTFISNHWLQDTPHNVLNACADSPAFKPPEYENAPYQFDNLTLIFYIFIGGSLQLFTHLHDKHRTIVCPYVQVSRDVKTQICAEVVLDALSSVFADTVAFANLQVIDLAYVDPLKVECSIADTESVDLEVAVLLSLGNDANLYRENLLSINNGDSNVYYLPTTSVTVNDVAYKSGNIFSHLGSGCSWTTFGAVFERRDRSEKWWVQRAVMSREVNISRLAFDALQFIFLVKSRTRSDAQRPLCTLVTYKPTAPAEGIFFFQFTVHDWVAEKRRTAARLLQEGEVYVVLGSFSKMSKNLLRPHQVAAKTGFTPQWDFMLNRDAAGQFRVSWLEANADLEMSPGPSVDP
ncbi:hypothetical protein CERZMDRAFT_101670 [Cercospora zeae-maydis SCOH1-5]|uniref:Uncharacterized protein n=1 Tax=Cercospora zeae-maydis SCOH1-5 TaxID=717836 RepID=A0A6A6F4R1_9PEZI|nr:hypothetical protein CERZMDRAFT_101670 [Cercospora zeae-maydis SCOH1-5]